MSDFERRIERHLAGLHRKLSAIDRRTTRTATQLEIVLPALVGSDGKPPLAARVEKLEENAATRRRRWAAVLAWLAGSTATIAAALAAGWDLLMRCFGRATPTNH